MLRQDFIKSLQEGKVLKNEHMDKLFKDTDGDYTFMASGICARAVFMTESESDPTIVHFQRYILIDGNQKIPMLKFTVCTDGWEVKE